MGVNFLEIPKQKYLYPIIEPEKVNERRGKVGLESIEKYLKRHGMVWDVEKHKAQIKKLELSNKE